MMQEGLREVIREFVALVECGSESPQDNERVLRLFVDRLALAVSECDASFGDSHYEGGDGVDYSERRAVVCRQFPELGYYNVPASIAEDIANTELHVGDAIDDLIDIRSELAGVLQIWETTGEAQAMRALAAAYAMHLGDHLRDLQRYLHARQREN